MNEAPSQVVVFPRNEVNLNSSIAERICYDKFIPRVNYLMEEIKNSTNICVNGANLKTQTKEKVKLIKGLSDKCVLELNPIKYFTCMKSIAVDIKKILNEIVLITKNFSKQNKTECLIEIFERAKYRSSSAYYDLNLCLQNIDQSILLTTTPEPFDKVLEDIYDDYNDEVDNIKAKYETFKKCVLNGLDFNICWKQVGNIDAYGPSFKEFTDYDKAENSCISQFIFLFYQYERFEFDLEGCLRYGYTSVIQYEENEEKDIQLIRNLIKFYNSFNVCRVISKDLNTDNCIVETLRHNLAFEIQNEFLMKSEENFKKLNKIIKKLYIEHLPCIEDMLLIFQFDSLDIYSSRRSNLKNCLMLGHKLPSTRHTKEILGIFGMIQDNIKSCTIHRNSPGLEQCLYNYVSVYANFLRSLVHPELVDEFDKNQHTCFRFILKRNTLNFEDHDHEELRNCLFKKS